MNDDQLLHLRQVQRIGLAAPSRWTALTADARPVEIRLRHGELTVRIGPENGTIDQAKQSPAYISIDLPDAASWASWSEVAAVAGLSIADASSPE